MLSWQAQFLRRDRLGPPAVKTEVNRYQLFVICYSEDLSLWERLSSRDRKTKQDMRCGI
jgi:hypothetical protein